jgi:hypothetical protein
MEQTLTGWIEVEKMFAFPVPGTSSPTFGCGVTKIVQRRRKAGPLPALIV